MILKKTGPGIAPLAMSLAQLRKASVLVGIPQATVQRKEGPLNNATLAFLMEHGSPLNNTPARPFLGAGIEANKKLITPHLEAAAKAVIDKNPVKAEQELNVAGLVAANGVKRYVMSEDHLAPNAPSTIRRKGSSRPLVDTAQLIRAVTFVVKTEE